MSGILQSLLSGGGSSVNQVKNIPLPEGFPKPTGGLPPAANPTPGQRVKPTDLIHKPLPPGFPNYPPSTAAAGGAFAAGGSAQMPGEYSGFPDFPGFADGGTPNDMFEAAPAPEGGSNPLADFYHYLDRESRAAASKYASQPFSQTLREGAVEAAPDVVASALGPVGAGLKMARPIARAAQAFPKMTAFTEGTAASAAVDNASKMFGASPAEAQTKGITDPPGPMPDDWSKLSKPEAEAWQKWLNQNGEPVKLDGKIGKQTEGAIKELMRRKARDADRAVDETRAKADQERAKGETEAARAKAAAAQAETEKTNLETEKERNRQAEAKRLAEERRLGEAKLAAINKQMPWYQKAFQDYAPAVGYVLGGLGGVGAKALTNRGLAKLQNMRTTRANSLIDDIEAEAARPVRGRQQSDDSLVRRAGMENAAYMKGQPRPLPWSSRERQGPFLNAPEERIPIRPNPNMPSSAELYEPSRAMAAAPNIGWPAAFAADYGAMNYIMLPRAQAEAQAAWDELKTNPNSDEVIRRYLAAKDQEAFYKALANVGMTAGITYAGASAKMFPKYTQADTGRLEGRTNQDLMLLNRRLAADAARATRQPSPKVPSGGKPPEQITPSAMPTPAGQTASPQPTPGTPGKTDPSTSATSFPQPPPMKSRAEAETEFKANRKSRQGELAAEKRKAKKAPEGNEGEGRAYGGSVHHSNFQERAGNGQFAGGVVWPKGTNEESNVKWPGYDDGGTVKERKQSFWENPKGPARLPAESWPNFLFNRQETKDAVVGGIFDAVSAMAPGRGMPIRGGDAKGLTLGDFSKAKDVHANAFDLGEASFLRQPRGGEGAGRRHFDPGIADSLPPGDTSVSSARQPLPYRRIEGSANQRGNMLDDPPIGRQIPDDPHTWAMIDKQWDDMARASRRPDLTTIEGGLPPKPPGPYKAGGGPAMGMEGPGMSPDGPPVGGPIHGESPGRADDKPVSVASGSYVIPADVVSALGEGNTNAGMRKLQANFPHDGHDQGANAQAPPVPIRISDGEYVITPDQVMELGGGDMEQGHRILDRLVQTVRAQHIKNLKSMPPPAKG